jgi:ubiquinone/menaquinone biosynthesis C-methylase UbiE
MPSPVDELAKLISGYKTTQAIYVVAKLGIADLLAQGPRTVADLAGKAEVHDRSLFRVLRMLASRGIFAEQPDGRFALTPLAEPLRSDALHSQRAFAIMMGEEQFRAYGDLLYSVRTGKPSFDHIFGEPIFDYLGEHPESAATFDAAMSAIHGRETASILDAYDFTGIGELCDVGGGNGSVLIATLARYPSLRGVLFDLPHVIERARPAIITAGVADRCRLITGNFFESIYHGADAYFFRHIIHDWDDEKATAILVNCRRALKPGAKILVVESVVPPGNEPFFGEDLDLTMLVMPGGMERTEAEYRQLFAGAGLNLERIVTSPSEMCVIEAVAVNP